MFYYFCQVHSSLAVTKHEVGYISMKRN